MSGAAPLVSILIPAYNEKFLAAALSSALAQTFADIEILVADDSQGAAVAAIIEQAGSSRVRYVPNAQRRGFHGNFAHCFELALGRYVKFLNDDDVLRPDCVANMVAVMEHYGARVSLITARRQVIDTTGDTLADTPVTTPLADVNCIFDGRQFGNRILARSVNLIGEPSAVMFRRADVDLKGGTLFRIDEHEYTCLADLALWLRLLALGDMAYLALPLVGIRAHAGQLQQSAEVAARCITERVFLPRDARSLGFLDHEAQFQTALEHAAALLRQGLAQSNLDPAARKVLETAARHIAP